jgi:catechol 2,3-dioxygenase-like lactoylglutathione lyase family enzyme
MSSPSRPKLFPSQVCFVVDDVPAAAIDCVSRFGWGPFQQFTAPVDDAEYRGFRGRKVTDVALGMAGRVQVELIHVREGYDAIAAYQAEYGVGFQHLGIGVRSRDDALAHLEKLGGRLDSKTEYGGLRIAFVDLPTGPAMFELLEQAGQSSRKKGEAKIEDQTKKEDECSSPLDPNFFEVDRATIVTPDLNATLAFYSEAFGWKDCEAHNATLRHPAGQTQTRRALGRAGTLELELIEAQADGSDPYASHLRRGAHGLVHAGGALRSADESNPSHGQSEAGAAMLPYEWLETKESFTLENWAGGPGALQMRRAATNA